jgi:hypothetical protein
MEKVVEEELKGLTTELKKKEQTDTEPSSSEPETESKEEDNSTVSELSK